LFTLKDKHARTRINRITEVERSFCLGGITPSLNSWARALGDAMPEAEAHRHVTAIIAIHGKIRTTAEVIGM
jgi:hypothetical protein